MRRNGISNNGVMAARTSTRPSATTRTGSVTRQCTSMLARKQNASPLLGSSCSIQVTCRPMSTSHRHSIRSRRAAPGIGVPGATTTYLPSCRDQHTGDAGVDLPHLATEIQVARAELVDDRVVFFRLVLFGFRLWIALR